MNFILENSIEKCLAPEIFSLIALILFDEWKMYM